MIKILGIQKLTLLDYPGHLGAVIFLGGCNFRCPFCQNSSLVLAPDLVPEYSYDEFLKFLKKRQGILEGICVTGGEPTLCAELPSLLETIREMGYLVKLDTNGTNPDMLESLLTQGKLDYVAMDIKAGRENYARVAGLNRKNSSDSPCIPKNEKGSANEISASASRSAASDMLDRISRSADLLMHSSIDYEFRTTVVNGLHTEHDFEDIADWLAGCKEFYLQSFRDSDDILLPDHPFSSFREEEMNHFLSILRKKIPHAKLRGVS